VERDARAQMLQALKALAMAPVAMGERLHAAAPLAASRVGPAARILHMPRKSGNEPTEVRREPTTEVRRHR
jgi:hypothetical protein